MLQEHSAKLMWYSFKPEQPDRRLSLTDCLHCWFSIQHFFCWTDTDNRLERRGDGQPQQHCSTADQHGPTVHFVCQGLYLLISGYLCEANCPTECLWCGSLFGLEHTAVCLSPQGQTGTVKDQTLAFGRLTWFDNVTGSCIELEPQPGVSQQTKATQCVQKIFYAEQQIWHLREHFIYNIV